MPSDTGDPCAVPPSATYPVPPATSSAPEASSTPAPPLATAAVGTPLSRTGPISFDVRAVPGTRTVVTGPAIPRGVAFQIRSAHLVAVSGTAGAVSVLAGDADTSMSDQLGNFAEVTIQPPTPVLFDADHPDRVALTCAGSTPCRVLVTLSAGTQR